MKELSEYYRVLLSEKMETDLLNQKLLKDLRHILIDNTEENPCDYCIHHIHCKSKQCVNYEEGFELENEQGKRYNMKWSCEDFDYGTCDRLKDTPCYNCIQENFQNWEYDGKRK